VRIITSIGLLALFGLPARADLVSIQVSGLPAYTYNGYYVGPAQATDNGAGPFDFWCDDFTHETYVPTTYYADVSTIGTLNTARFGFDTQGYEEVAWLVGQYYSMPNKTPGSVGDLQFAIWLVFDPSGPSLLHTPGATAWLNAVPGNLSAYNYSGARIFTPTNCSGGYCEPGNQEFYTPPVPEPTSILLLGSAALIALFVVRRKMSRAATKCASRT
jgi:PEP-CTERM motif